MHMYCSASRYIWFFYLSDRIHWNCQSVVSAQQLCIIHNFPIVTCYFCGHTHTHTDVHACTEVHTPAHKKPPSSSPSLLPVRCFCANCTNFAAKLKSSFAYFALFYFIFYFPVGLEYFLLLLFTRFFAGCPLYRCLAEKYKKFSQIYASHSVVTQAISMQNCKFYKLFWFSLHFALLAKGVELGHQFGHWFSLHSNNWDPESLTTNKVQLKPFPRCEMKQSRWNDEVYIVVYYILAYRKGSKQNTFQ